MIETLARSEPLIVVGMKSEARIARRLGRVAVGTAELDRALATCPAAVISFGLCGSLSSPIRVGDLLVGTEVVGGDEAFACDPNLFRRIVEATGGRPARFAGSSEILDSVQAKASWRASSAADAVDLETLDAARVAKAAGAPFAILRAVSDGAGDSLPRSAIAGFRPDGRTDVSAVVAALARRPWELPALLRTARNAGKAMHTLARAADNLAGAL